VWVKVGDEVDDGGFYYLGDSFRGELLGDVFGYGK
jgi:hypothetical protein